MNDHPVKGILSEHEPVRRKAAMELGNSFVEAKSFPLDSPKGALQALYTSWSAPSFPSGLRGDPFLSSLPAPPVSGFPIDSFYLFHLVLLLSFH